jgi:hypothetical protein
VNFSDPACCIEKHDIIEHSNDPLMPMQLRMFAEQVLERPLMGQSSATMLQMQMKWEAGNIYGTHVFVNLFPEHLDPLARFGLQWLPWYYSVGSYKILEFCGSRSKML